MTSGVLPYHFSKVFFFLLSKSNTEAKEDFYFYFFSCGMHTSLAVHIALYLIIVHIKAKSLSGQLCQTKKKKKITLNMVCGKNGDVLWESVMNLPN